MATRKKQSRKKATAKKTTSSSSSKKKAASKSTKKAAKKTASSKASPARGKKTARKSAKRKTVKAVPTIAETAPQAGDDIPARIDEPTTDRPDRPAVVAEPAGDAAASRHIWEIVWVRDLFMIGVAVLLVWFLYSERAITLPVMLGLLLAYLFNPLVTMMNKRYNVSRTVSAAAILLLCACVIALVTRLVVPTLVKQANDLYGQRNSLLSGIRVIHDLSVDIGLLDEDPSLTPDPKQPDSRLDPNKSVTPDPGKSSTTLPDAADELTLKDGTKLVGTITDMQNGQVVFRSEVAGEIKIPAGQIAGVKRNGKPSSGAPTTRRVSADTRKAVTQLVFKALGIGYGLISGLFDWVVYTALFATIIGFCFFFFTRDFNAVIRWISQFVPAKHQGHAAHLVKQMDESVSAFVRGRMVQSLLMAINLSIGWAVVGWFWPELAVPYFLIIAVLGGVLNLVPYAGIVACIAAVGLTWIERLSGGTSITPGLGVAITLVPTAVFVVAQIIDGWIIEPLVQGHATNLSPLAILLAVLIGGSVAGILGLIVAIPVASCLKIVAKEVIVPHLKRYVQQLP